MKSPDSTSGLCSWHHVDVHAIEITDTATAEVCTSEAFAVFDVLSSVQRHCICMYCIRSNLHSSRVWQCCSIRADVLPGMVETPHGIARFFPFVSLLMSRLRPAGQLICGGNGQHPVDALRAVLFPALLRGCHPGVRARPHSLCGRRRGHLQPSQL